MVDTRFARLSIRNDIEMVGSCVMDVMRLEALISITKPQPDARYACLRRIKSAGRRKLSLYGKN